MKPLRLGFAALAALALGACAARYTATETMVSGATETTISGGYAPDYYDMSYDERHHAWWAENERDQAFEQRMALNERP